MFRSSHPIRLKAHACVWALAAGAALYAAPVLAQEAVATAPAAMAHDGSADNPSPSDSLAVNLVRRMAAKGLISKSDADDPIANAQADTARARAAEAPVRELPGAETAQAQMQGQAGVIRVPYIPENVRAEIKDDLRKEVTQEAKDQHWAAPGLFPDWAERLTIFGDFRFRDESRFFGKSNANDFINFNAVNQGSPWDPNSGHNPPILNSTQNRNLQQLRARLGFDFKINDQVDVTMRVASGNDNGAISTIQTFGADETKFELWLDQAYLTWKPVTGASLIFGRAPNPFTSTEILWKQDDFQLDGVFARYGHDVPWLKGLSAYATLGASPLDYVDNSLPTALSSDKPGSDDDKYLFGGQAGVAYQVTPRLTASANLGYYDFHNIQGRLSSECLNTSDFCQSDWSRPSFMQKGNTLFALRNLVSTDPSTNAAEPQYFGLASKFRVLDSLVRLDWAQSDKLHVVFTGDFVRNLAYDANAILARNPVTDVATVNGKTVLQSGNTAWLARLQVGAPKVVDRFDWSLAMAYARIDPDAVVDAFDDKDFRLGGTNSKGWILQSDLGVARNTWLTAKLLTADAVYGSPYSVDVLQLDLNARF